MTALQASIFYLVSVGVAVFIGIAAGMDLLVARVAKKRPDIVNEVLAVQRMSWRELRGNTTVNEAIPLASGPSSVPRPAAPPDNNVPDEQRQMESRAETVE